MLFKCENFEIGIPDEKIEKDNGFLNLYKKLENLIIIIIESDSQIDK